MDRSDRFIIQVISVILCVFLLVYVSFQCGEYRRRTL